MDILKAYLGLMIKQDASDLYLTTGAKPSIKVHGKILTVGHELLPSGQVKKIAYSILSPEQINHFEDYPELNLAWTDEKSGRFRINIFRQRNEVAMVIRSIKTIIPTLEELGLPPIMKQLVMEKRGLVLIVGATSMGKSTTLASMIDYRNQNATGHIITIEDPIEFVHQHKMSLVNQREVGIDTTSYADALKNTLRQAPDVILIGEVRTRETMEHAISFAETGHLCLSTLHANNANQALERIIHFFPEENHSQLFLDLSLNLVAIVSQRLIPSLDGKRALAVEVLLTSPLVKELIRKGEVGMLKDVMEKSENLGMQTFDSALFKLFVENKISEEEALINADSANNVRLRIAVHRGVIEKEGDELQLQQEGKDENMGIFLGREPKKPADEHSK